MEQGSGSTGGSSQWVCGRLRDSSPAPGPGTQTFDLSCLLQCQMPLYESFDYFEGLQAGRGTK